ncbi:hypothetical protein ACFX2C_009376 [Malus domestica]
MENLYIYFAISKVAVTSALIHEELGAQLLIFYTSKALLDAKIRYQKIEKLILVLVIAAQKLKPYFQAHTVFVMTQSLADFITEFTPSLVDTAERPNDAPEATKHTLAMPASPDETSGICMSTVHPTTRARKQARSLSPQMVRCSSRKSL